MLNIKVWSAWIHQSLIKYVKYFPYFYALIKGKAIPVTGRGDPEGCETPRLPHFLDNRLRDGGKVISLKPRPPFTPGRSLVLISVRDWVDPRAIVRLEGLDQLKNPITSSEIETATCGLKWVYCIWRQTIMECHWYYYCQEKTEVNGENLSSVSLSLPQTAYGLLSGWTRATAMRSRI
jgi:hypothetical protein